MSAGGALQSAIASALATMRGVTGIYDGPPARAPYPYVTIDAGSEIDWSHKTGSGREVFVAITVWDEQPVRLHALADDAEARVAALVAVESWQLVTLRFIRRRIVRDVTGPWAAVVDLRARLLAAD